jgi:hypothetical protein
VSHTENAVGSGLTLRTIRGVRRRRRGGRAGVPSALDRGMSDKPPINDLTEFGLDPTRVEYGGFFGKSTALSNLARSFIRANKDEYLDKVISC